MSKINIDDIVTSVTTPALILDTFIKNGTFHELPTGDVEMYTGGFTLVFPVKVIWRKMGISLLVCRFR